MLPINLIEKELKGCQNGGNDQDGSGEANGKTAAEDPESIKQLKVVDLNGLIK